MPKTGPTAPCSLFHGSFRDVVKLFGRQWVDSAGAGGSIPSLRRALKCPWAGHWEGCDEKITRRVTDAKINAQDAAMWSDEPRRPFDHSLQFHRVVQFGLLCLVMNPALPSLWTLNSTQTETDSDERSRKDVAETGAFLLYLCGGFYEDLRKLGQFLLLLLFNKKSTMSPLICLVANVQQ